MGRVYSGARRCLHGGFLMQVMEVVLDFVMAYLEFLTSKLEATAHPILDSIVHKACTLGPLRICLLFAGLRFVAHMSCCLMH